MAPREEEPHEKRDMLLPRIQRLDSPASLAQPAAFAPISRLPGPLRFRG